MAETRERPILFSGPMVRAILDGRKTQTRRMLDPQPPPAEAVRALCGTDFGLHAGRDGAVRVTGPVWAVREALGTEPTWRGRFGGPGDRLWVRETWALTSRDGSTCSIAYAARLPPGKTLSDTDGGVDIREAPAAFTMEPNPVRWRPSIHMPRWASRLTLEVVSVRVERLHAITEEDAKAEGAFFTDYGRRCLRDWKGPGPCPAPDAHHRLRSGWAVEPTTSHEQCLDSARMAFANLWERINGAESWDANPWVRVVEFRRVEASTRAAALEGVC